MESLFGGQINLYSLLIKQNVYFFLFAPLIHAYPFLFETENILYGLAFRPQVSEENSDTLQECVVN